MGLRRLAIAAMSAGRGNQPGHKTSGYDDPDPFSCLGPANEFRSAAFQLMNAHILHPNMIAALATRAGLTGWAAFGGPAQRKPSFPARPPDGCLVVLSLWTFTVTTMQLRHVCEVCGVEEILTPDVASANGWDYPPSMGAFGVIGPRTCSQCAVNQTVWWAIAVEGCTIDMLTAKQQATVARILGDPDIVDVPQIDDPE